jgi:large subunit ribosomal protein L4
MNLTIKNIKGADAGEHTVAFEVLEDEKGNQAVHDAVVAYMAAQRSGTACTKTVGEVSGSNKKPWRQKGTGRARVGEKRNPIWRGGGVAHGPKPRDFTKTITKKTRRLALLKALGERIKAGDVIVVDDLKLGAAKTKEFVAVLKALKVEGTVQLVIDQLDENLLLSCRNIPHVDVTTGTDLNTYEVLKNDKLVFSKAAFEAVEKRITQN